MPPVLTAIWCIATIAILVSLFVRNWQQEKTIAELNEKALESHLTIKYLKESYRHTCRTHGIKVPPEVDMLDAVDVQFRDV